MTNFRLDHNIPRGPEGINGYYSGMSPYDYGKCPKGYEWVPSYKRDKSGKMVGGYCRKKIKKNKGKR
jgi:hypothetical protein